MEALLAEVGYGTAPRYNSRSVCGAHLALRGEILQLHELRRQVCVALYLAIWQRADGCCLPLAVPTFVSAAASDSLLMACRGPVVRQPAAAVARCNTCVE
jgi:hypothetical protein